MIKKEFILSLVLALIIAIIGPVIAFMAGIENISNGFPLEWTSFNFLGSETDYIFLLIDIIFWFFVIWICWKVFFKRSKK